MWIGPLQMIKKLGEGKYRLQNMEGKNQPLPINVHHLKIIFS